MELGRCLGKAIGQLLQEDNVMLFSSHGLIRGWKAFLSLSAWISGGMYSLHSFFLLLRFHAAELAGSPETKAISQKLFRRTMSSCIASSAVGEFYSDVLSIALLQIKLSPKIESLDLAEILAGYLLITSVKTSQGRRFFCFKRLPSVRFILYDIQRAMSLSADFAKSQHSINTGCYSISWGSV